MEFLLNLSEDEEVACTVRGHMEILAEEAKKQEFARQHISRTFFSFSETRSAITVLRSNPNIGKHHVNREALMLPIVSQTLQNAFYSNNVPTLLAHQL